MLAYLLVQALRRRWRDIDLTVQEALDRLASLCLIEVSVGGRPSYNQVPTPRDDVRRLFEAADVAIPTALPLASARVATSPTFSTGAGWERILGLGRSKRRVGSMAGF